VSPTNLLHEVETTDHNSAGAVAEEINEELEMADVAPPPFVTPVVIPPRMPQSEDEPLSPQRMRVLDHLLSMADQYSRIGSIRQAIELYFELVTDHPDTEQAAHAGDQLLVIAQHYTDRGELRQARGIYERLLKVS
jgi:tetratricopeptide (TPR) repeat protein